MSSTGWPLPRLSIWHLLFWCTVSAILLAFTGRGSLEADPVGYLIAAFCHGGTVTVSMLLLVALSKHAPIEPGYWFAIASLIDGFTLWGEPFTVSIWDFGEMPQILFTLAFATADGIGTGK